MTKAQMLREIISKPGILVLPGVYDCVGARLVEQIGFEVVFTSGFGISASTLGLPDFGFMTETEMVWSVGRMAKSVNIPLVADIDTGYGNQLNVIKTVKDIINLGVAGVILEDQEWPKKCGHFDGKRVIDKKEHVEKIRAAIHAGADSELVIIARTDSREPLGLDEAIRRGHAYFEAGADVIFIEAPQSTDEIKEISRAFPAVPLFANIVEGGKTPMLSANELEALGFKIAVFPLSGLFAATRAMKECFSHIKEHKTVSGYDNDLLFEDFEGIIDVDAYKRLENEFRFPKNDS